MLHRKFSHVLPIHNIDENIMNDDYYVSHTSEQFLHVKLVALGCMSLLCVNQMRVTRMHCTGCLL